MQPRTGKHRPLPAGNTEAPSTSPDQLPHAPLELGSPPERNNGGLPPAPLQDMSPNVPLLTLSQYPSPGSKLLGSPNVARRLSFSVALPGVTGFSGLHDFAATTSNTNLKFEDDGISPLLARIAPPPGCPWLAEFGELADLSKLGSLPSEDDILLKFAEHPRQEIIAAGGDEFMRQQQDHYLQQPGSYFQIKQQHSNPHHETQMWVPHQSYEGDFAGTPTPLFSAADDPLGQRQQQYHHTHLQSGMHPSSSASSFYLSGNVHPGSTAAAAAGYATPRGDHYSQRSKRRAESELRPARGGVPRSSVAITSRAQNSKQQRQNGTYSGYQTSFPLSGYQQQQQQQPRKNTTTAKNRNTKHQLSALLDDFESDDPGATTGKSYRGVSRHRLTQRWEASLWLNGRQLYLGGFDAQIDAAKAYDLAALACKGLDAIINFSPEEYEQQLKEIAGFSREEVVAYVRRRSAAFSRGKSKYRGVSGHNGRWEARIGSFNGRKNVSFGVFETEECAGRQYDRALILEKGRSAKTNFPLRDYEAEVEVYKTYMARACGQLPRGSSAVAREVEAYTLPRNRVATADEKKRSAIIYGESLRQALEV